MTYAISNVEGDHLGFILLSGGPDSGDCLVRSQPFDSHVKETNESVFLRKLQLLGELKWERVTDEFQIMSQDGEVLLVEKAGRMRGAGFNYMVEEIS
ncbi:MAG: hypothetical protein AB8G18_17335 [Gammaproteobacteria bacterium]